MRLWPVVAVAAVVLVALVPIRREVAGVSMAPGLLPGDRVTTSFFPAFDRWREPRRDEWWVLAAPDGSMAIKRLVAIGGQTVGIVDGDLMIDGRIEPPSPAVLTERASVVERAVCGAPSVDPTTSRPVGRQLVWKGDGSTILDEAPFAPDERRVLLPVRDVGVCVLVTVPPDAVRRPSSRFLIGIGPRTVAWRPSRAVRYAFLAGRVDRHLVAAVWPLSPGGSEITMRDTLPEGAPEHWDVLVPWEHSTEDVALTVSIESTLEPRPNVEQIVVWRDLLNRPTANGTTEWRLGPDEVFVLGDFPSGSIDSRRWGPLPRRVLTNRVFRSREWRDHR